jgi:FAD/FMN-containing dehydrogenase
MSDGGGMIDLASRFSGIVGADRASSGDAAAAEAHDIFRALEPPAHYVRPRTVEHLQACVELAAAARSPILVRGGGASYTLGYAPARKGAVLIDTADLNRILDVDAARMTVAVEPGVTWAALEGALRKEGLRTPFWGPYSGAAATIGGSLSQHAISMGSGLYETSAQSVVALRIVDGRGRTFSTSASAHPFFRTHGPDLTGLFLGDCGALGIKAAITLKLMRRPSHVSAVSFSYPDFPAMAAAMADVASRSIASEILGLDPEIQKGFLGALNPKTALANARAIIATTANPIEAGIALLGASTTMRDLARGDRFVAHFTVEGWSLAEVRAKTGAIRKVARQGAGEIANAAPLALRGDPFLPLFPVAPADGSRWLPTHGLLPSAAIAEFHHAFEAWRARHGGELDARRIRMTRMFVPVGANACIYEPTFYWPDSRTSAQERLAPQEYLARVPILPANEATRAFVFELRRELTELMAAHGAQHFQLGKWYRYGSLLAPPACEALRALKAELDPHGLLNPGALEL